MSAQESFNELFEDATELSNNVDNHVQNTSSNSSSENKILEPAVIQQEYCYCSNCGNKIKVNSKFCRFCGEKNEEAISAKLEPELNLTSSVSHHEIVTSGKLEVKVSSNSKVKKSTVANEIVANLKMIALAFLIWGLYMMCFVCYHAKDVAPVTETSSYFGESCYDEGIISGSWEFSWEKHLATSISFLGKKNKFGFRDHNSLGTFDYLFLSNLNPDRALEEAKRMARQKNIGEEEYNQLVIQAKNAAQRDRDSFNQEISDRRKRAYEEDLHTHMLWSAIIALAITIIGRYFIKGCKWVANNKTS